MLIHSMSLGLVCYVLMIMSGQNAAIAENRSVLLVGVSAVYMVMFGHALPSIDSLRSRL